MKETWWETIQRQYPFDYGRDTGTWNRAKIIGVIDTFMAIAEIMGEPHALALMQTIPTQTILDQLNRDKTADNITLLREDA